MKTFLPIKSTLALLSFAGMVMISNHAFAGANPAATLSPSLLPNGTVGQSYSQTLTTTINNTAPYNAFSPNWRLSVIGNTDGLNFSEIGDSPNFLLSGTPTASGNFSFTLYGVDYNDYNYIGGWNGSTYGPSGSNGQSFNLAVSGGAAPEIDGALIPQVGFLLAGLFLMFGHRKENKEQIASRLLRSHATT